MARRTDARVLLVLAALGAAACDREAPTPPAPSSSVAAPAPAASPPPVPSARRPSPEPAACRALVVEGSARPLGSDKPLVKGAALDGKSWLELDEGAKIALRHSRSARELSVTGPALLLPCRDGDEQFLLARGELVTTMGPGARPGAEVLVATPLGTVRYADAGVQIRALGRRVEIAVRTGTATVEPAAGATLQGKPRLEPRGKGALRGNPVVSALVKSCEDLATEAEAHARAVLAGPRAAPDGGQDAGTLGERAAAHVAARQKARGACTVAAVAAALAPEADRGAVLGRVATADRRWKSVPRASGR